MDRISKARELRDTLEASRYAIQNLIRIDDLSAEELDKLKAIYPSWRVDTKYSLGYKVRYKDDIYEVIQEHKSQENWTPDAVPNLFNKIVPEGVIPEWREPLGSHDAYNIGDKVLFEGSVYKSIIDGNVYSPGSYPQGWEILEEV